MLLFNHFPDGVGDALHQPLRGGCGAADPYRTASVEPLFAEFGLILDVVAAGIGLLADMEQDFAVGALFAANEDDRIETAGELFQMGVTV